jgi:putative DNA primase/helicase
MSPLPHPDFDVDELSGRETGPMLLTTLANTVTPSKPVWVIDRWILRGAVNLGTGRQGAGKTTFAAYMVACITTAQTFPGDTLKEPMNAAVLSLEEPDDLIVARLHAAGADLERVHLFGDVDDVDEGGRRFRRRWQLPRDIGILGEAIIKHRIDVVIVDGLGYSISGDSHNYAVVGSALAALAGEAERTDTAIIGLVHPPKGASDPVTAAIGSTAWTALPRVCFVLGVDPEDDTKRVARVAKTNYKEPEHGISFIIGEDIEFECGYVANVAESDITAEQITGAPVTAEERSDRADAREWLISKIGQDRLDSKSIKSDWRKEGGSTRTLQRARADAGVIIEREGFGAEMVSWWSLPPFVPDGSDAPLVDSPGMNGNTVADQELFSQDDPSDLHSCPDSLSGTTGTNGTNESAFYNWPEF